MNEHLLAIECDFNAAGWSGEADDICYYVFDQLELEVRLPHRGRAVLTVRTLPLASTENRRIGSVLVIDDVTQQRMMAEARERVSEDANVPPRAGWIITRLIRIGAMLIFQVKAKPMHVLKHIVGVAVDYHRLVTSNADGRCNWCYNVMGSDHERLMRIA